MLLEELGWGPEWAGKLADLGDPGLAPARVTRADRDRHLVCGRSGEQGARLAGRMRHQAASPSALPTTGDWVAIRDNGAGSEAIIRAILPRKSVFLRRAENADGKPVDQTVAANIDTVFIVTGLDENYSVRRIERYLAIARDSGVIPVLLLNKLDLVGDAASQIRAVQRSAGGAPVHALSARDGMGMDAVRACLVQGKTYALLGSSGAGKTSIINALFGEERLAVTATSDFSGKGRHTTTARELLVLPGGAIVLDTPGMKMIKAWSDDGGLEETFADIEELATACRFGDCRHQCEPDCAVQAAVAEGSLDAGRLRNYIRLHTEVTALSRRRKELAKLQKTAAARRRARWGQGG